jgi:serine/threonine protein kinase
MAAIHGGLCAACLFEDALPPATPLSAAGSSHFTIQMPLGQSAASSVFLVKSEGQPPRLLRLKTWRRPAAAGFLARFHRLQTELDSWGIESVDRPIAASLDARGCPSVLTDFRQGVPILDRVRCGRLDREEAIALLTPLVALARKAHARGLVHGSIVAGNVIVEVESGRARLLDFGLTPLMASAEDRQALARADLAGFEALARMLRSFPDLPDSARQL